MTDLAVRELTRDQAVRLTQRIRDAAEETWALLMEAHEGRAWNAMGYGTWADYVSSEFGISRSRSYQLIDQAAVVRAIGGVVSTDVDISEADARRIKPMLAEVVDHLRDRTANLSHEQTAEVLREVIREVKQRQAEELAEQRAAFHAYHEAHPDALPKFVPTVPCPNCDGSGRLPKEEA